MSEELKEFQIRLHLETDFNIIPTERLFQRILDEKISSLLDIDEQMANLMIDFAKQRATEGIQTRELALRKWHETIWHKTLKSQIDKLRNLRKELE